MNKNLDPEVVIHTRAEHWCNNETSFGCKLMACMKRMDNGPECRTYRRKFQWCIDEKKEEFMKKYKDTGKL